MKPMIRSLMVALVLAAFVPSLEARIDQPSHIFYGNVTVFGDPVDSGTVIEARLVDSGELLVRYEMGRDPRLGDQYALPVSMDDVDPRTSGRARPGDEVEIFIGTSLAAETTVGAIGRAVRLDLDPQNLEGGPSISINDTELFEGNSGTSPAQLTVTMNTTADEDIKIDWQTADGTAVGGASCSGDIDYIAVGSSQLVIPAGDQAGTIDVEICGDTEIESDEAFTVELTGTNSGAFGKQSGEITILDDDDVPEIRVADTRIIEPQAGTAEAVFQVTLSKNSEHQASFSWTTQDVSATAPEDYTAANGTVEIEPGKLEAEIRVEVNSDDIVEAQEAFALHLSDPVSASLERSTVIGRIVDPEHDPALDHEQDAVDGENGITGISDPSAVAISRDGDHVYVTSESTARMTIFNRLPADGRIELLESIDAGTAGFADLEMGGPVDIAISDDDEHVYVAASTSDAVVVFSRNTGDGTLSFVENQINGIGDVTGLDGASHLHLSSDGNHLYVSSDNADSVAVFERDTATGSLTFLEAETNGVVDPDDGVDAPAALDHPAGLTVSPDGTQVFVAARTGNALVIFDRNNDESSPDFGSLSYRESLINGLSGIEGLEGATDVAIGSSGDHVYVTAELSNGLVRFDRGGDGNLELIRTWAKDTGGVPGMGGTQRLELSPDNAELFVTGFGDDSLTVFARTTEEVSSATAGKLSLWQTLFDEQGDTAYLAGPTDMAASHDNRHVYVVANEDNAIVVFTRLSSDAMFSDRFQ